jgi:hypothetical protein
MARTRRASAPIHALALVANRQNSAADRRPRSSSPCWSTYEARRALPRARRCPPRASSPAERSTRGCGSAEPSVRRRSAPARAGGRLPEHPKGWRPIAHSLPPSKQTAGTPVNGQKRGGSRVQLGRGASLEPMEDRQQGTPWNGSCRGERRLAAGGGEAENTQGNAPTKKARRRHLYEDLGLSMSESDRERAERAAERAEREAPERDRAK